MVGFAGGLLGGLCWLLKMWFNLWSTFVSSGNSYNDRVLVQLASGVVCWGGFLLFVRLCLLCGFVFVFAAGVCLCVL